MIQMKGKKIISGCFWLAMLPLSAAAQGQRTMSVDELFSLVETGSRTLRAQKAGVGVASRGVEEAKSQRLPDIGASLSLSYNGNVVMTDRDFGNATGFSSPHIGNSFALEARQTVYAGGALSAGIRLAELQKEQAETAVEQTRAAQRLVALGQYLDIFKADNSIRVYERNIALTERLIADIRAKHAEGMALKNDVTRYELQMETLRLGLRKMEDSRRVLSYQLCNTLGIEQTVIAPDTATVRTAMGEATEGEWQQRAAAQSPTLRLSGIGVSLSEQQLRLARSEMLPRLSVVAADNFSGPFTYDVPPIDKNFNVWYVGVGVSYSLSSLFKSNKAVRRAAEAVRQSRELRGVAAEAIDNQMQEAYTLYRQSFADLRTQRKSVELSRQNYEVMNDRYLNQLALVTDMVDASNILLNAELQEVNARINIVYAYYRMKFIAGEI